MLGARTWYPAADERNGSYQLQKAEERANQEHAANLMRIERLRESRLRRELGRVGGAHSVFPLAIGSFHHRPSWSATLSSTRGAPCAVHGTNPIKSGNPALGNKLKQIQPMNGPNTTGFQQGNKQQMNSPQNNMQKMGQQNNMQKNSQQNNMQQMGQQKNTQQMGQQTKMGQQNSMQQMGQHNNTQKVGQQNNNQRSGNNQQVNFQQPSMQKSGNNQQMNFQQSSPQKSGSSPKNMQHGNIQQMSYQQNGGHISSPPGNKQSMGQQNMQKGDDQHMHIQNTIVENKIQQGHKQQSVFDQDWSGGQIQKSLSRNQSFEKDNSFMQPIQLKRSYSDSHQKARNYPTSSRASSISNHNHMGGGNGRSLYSDLLDYDFHCNYHDRILHNEIKRALMLPKLDKAYYGGRRRSSSFVF